MRNSPMSGRLLMLVLAAFVLTSAPAAAQYFGGTRSGTRPSSTRP